MAILGLRSQHKYMKLTKKQRLYIDYSLANPGLSDAKIAEACDISTKQICYWHKNPEFEAEIDKALKEQWAGYVKQAQEVMQNLMLNATKEEVQLNAAKYIMDSNGWKPTDKVEVDANINTIKVTIEDAD